MQQDMIILGTERGRAPVDEDVQTVNRFSLAEAARKAGLEAAKVGQNAQEISRFHGIIDPSRGQGRELRRLGRRTFVHGLPMPTQPAGVTASGGMRSLAMPPGAAPLREVPQVCVPTGVLPAYLFDTLL